MRQAIVFTESSLNIGGQELQQLAQMQALRALGWQTRLICHPASRIGEEAAVRGLPVIPAPLRSAGDLGSVRIVRRIIAELRPAAVVSHSQHDAYIAALAARTVLDRPRLLRMRTYMGSVNRMLFNHLVDLTLTPSEALRQQVLASGKVRPDKIEVLYPGIDFAALDARSVAEPDPPELARWLAARSGPVILLAAMFRAEKGHAVLLRAFARMRQQCPDAVCVLAGEGALRPEIETLVRELGVGSHVFFAGMVANVAPLMRRANLLVVPSQSEPLGMSQIEALALGTPVVASRVGGIPETVSDGRTGLLVEANDVDAWQEALRRAVSEPVKMRELARQGQADVRARFSLQTNVESLLAHAGAASRQRPAPG